MLSYVKKEIVLTARMGQVKRLRNAIACRIGPIGFPSVKNKFSHRSLL